MGDEEAKVVPEDSLPEASHSGVESPQPPASGAPGADPVPLSAQRFTGASAAVPSAEPAVVARRSSIRPAPASFRPTRSTSTRAPSMVIHSGDVDGGTSAWLEAEAKAQGLLDGSGARSGNEPFGLSDELHQPTLPLSLPPPPPVPSDIPPPRHPLPSFELEQEAASDEGAELVSQSRGRSPTFRPLASVPPPPPRSPSRPAIAQRSSSKPPSGAEGSSIGVSAPSAADTAALEPQAAAVSIVEPVVLEPDAEAAATAAPAAVELQADAAAVAVVEPQTEAAAVAAPPAEAIVEVSEPTVSELEPDAPTVSRSERPGNESAAAVEAAMAIAPVVSGAAATSGFAALTSRRWISTVAAVVVGVVGAWAAVASRGGPTNSLEGSGQPAAKPSAMASVQAEVVSPVPTSPAPVVPSAPTVAPREVAAAPSATTSAATDASQVADKPASSEGVKRVTINVKQADVKLSVRGVPLSGPPYVVEVPVGKRVAVVIEKPGYATRKLVLNGKKSIENVGLVATKVPAPTKKAPPARSR